MRTLQVILITVALSWGLYAADNVLPPHNLTLAISIVQLFMLAAILKRLDRENPSP